MIVIATLVPWVLTVAALLFIIIKSNRADHEMPNEEYDESERDFIRVAVYDDKAYWVYDNIFYESDTVREPDFTTARPVDTMDLPPKELNKLLSILDELEDSKNERE